MSTQQSHAVDPAGQSAVPGSVQRNAPRGVEEKLPDSVSPSVWSSWANPS